MLSPTMPSYHRLDSQLLRRFGQSVVLRQNSTDSRLSAASSRVNFLRHDDDSMSRRSQSFSGHVSGGWAGMGIPGSHMEAQLSGREGIMRSFMDSLPGQAAGVSAFDPNSLQPSPPHVSPPMSASSVSGSPTSPVHTPSAGQHAAYVPLPHPQSTQFTGQTGRSSILTASQETSIAPQRKEGTRQPTDDSLQSMSALGWHSAQLLIPIRSGEVELFVRQQPRRSSGSFPAPVPEQVNLS